jgi:thymidine kinase
MAIEIPKHPIGNEFPQYFKMLKDKGRLDELVTPQPELVADEILNEIVRSERGTVHILWADSMFSGKTTTAILASRGLNQEGIDTFCFQPEAAIRFGEEQKHRILTNHRKQELSLPAITTGNHLEDICTYIETADMPSNPLIIIDDLMLYVDHGKKIDEVANRLEEMQRAGFHVIGTGLTKTFQAEPFTFYQDLVDICEDMGWFGKEMSTVCVECGNKAKATRRYIVDEKTNTRRIANYNDPYVLAGSHNAYEPVCVDFHPSCIK